jgi:hypothetical protein
MTYTLEQLNQDIETIKSFSNLSSDWDSYGSHPPTSTAIYEACKFLKDFFYHRAGKLIRPRPSPLAGGIETAGVCLHYTCANGLILIDFYNDGDVAAASSKKEGYVSTYAMDMPIYFNWIVEQIRENGGPRD